jgi:hypothetical protein
MCCQNAHFKPSHFSKKLLNMSASSSFAAIPKTTVCRRASLAGRQLNFFEMDPCKLPSSVKTCVFTLIGPTSSPQQLDIMFAANKSALEEFKKFCFRRSLSFSPLHETPDDESKSSSCQKLRSAPDHYFRRLYCGVMMRNVGQLYFTRNSSNEIAIPIGNGGEMSKEFTSHLQKFLPSSPDHAAHSSRKRKVMSSSSTSMSTAASHVMLTHSFLIIRFLQPHSVVMASYVSSCWHKALNLEAAMQMPFSTLDRELSFMVEPCPRTRDCTVKKYHSNCTDKKYASSAPYIRFLRNTDADFAKKIWQTKWPLRKSIGRIFGFHPSISSPLCVPPFNQLYSIRDKVLSSMTALPKLDKLTVDFAKQQTSKYVRVANLYTDEEALAYVRIVKQVSLKTSAVDGEGPVDCEGVVFPRRLVVTLLDVMCAREITQEHVANLCTAFKTSCNDDELVFIGSGDIKRFCDILRARGGKLRLSNNAAAAGGAGQDFTTPPSKSQ